MGRRGIIQLTAEDLHYLMGLNPGEHVAGMWPDPLRDSIMIGIEGDETTDLPEVVPGTSAPYIERPYAVAKLRDRLAHIVATVWRRESDRDAYLRAVGELVEKQVFPSLGIVPSPNDMP